MQFDDVHHVTHNYNFSSKFINGRIFLKNVQILVCIHVLTSDGNLYL